MEPVKPYPATASLIHAARCPSCGEWLSLEATISSKKHEPGLTMVFTMQDFLALGWMRGIAFFCDASVWHAIRVKGKRDLLRKMAELEGRASARSRLQQVAGPRC